MIYPLRIQPFGFDGAIESRRTRPIHVPLDPGDSGTNKKIQTFIVGFILLLGIGCRFLVSIRGFNYDFESYLLVVDILG
jgi:hypothetical protein